MDFSTITWNQVLTIFGICAGASIIGAIALLATSAKQIKNLDIPENADFFTTLQSIPITIPIALDLLDFAFDFFAAPIAWVLLELLGLQALQMITIFEGILPGTQLLPTMTGAWIIARVVGNKRSPSRDAIEDYNLHQIEEKRQKRLLMQESYKRKPLLGDSKNDVVDAEYIEEPDVIILDKDLK